MNIDAKDDLNKSANTCLSLGAGVGALGLGAALVVGTVCPLCIIATPLLLSAGIVQKVRAHNKSTKEDNITENKERRTSE